MQLVVIQVECYAGQKADETPRRFLWEGEGVEVEEVVDRWHQIESKPEWPRADYFKVRDPDQSEYLLKHDLESNEWYLGRRWRRVADSTNDLEGVRTSPATSGWGRRRSNSFARSISKR